MTIEQRLQARAVDDSGNSLLLAQWTFDKALLGRALNTVSVGFPHYSLHDVTHSETILREIEKIHGRHVEVLSAVDCWLLLEAAYWHDIGMVFAYSERVELIESEEFEAFLQQLQNEPSDLQKHARRFSEQLEGENLTEKVEFLEAERSLRFVIAEYIRRIHPRRGKAYLDNPESAGVPTPRTGLINRRLFSVLGDIIETHGGTPESVMKLDHSNDGLVVGDNAHPRFVAAMLRIGDLLDLEDGRHSPTLLKTTGPIPPTSEAHRRKHRSIQSKVVTPKSIMIRAVCSDFESFELQNDWFTMLKQEIESHNRTWGLIAPDEYIPSLPTVEALSCELEGHLRLFDESARLRLDSRRAYEFLSGALLYSKPYAAIPELLQNAVDAIIDRIWLENRPKDRPSTIDDFHRLIKENNHEIRVNVSDERLDDDDVRYTVKVSDTGKGLAFDEIRELAEVASTSGLRRKQKYRGNMPDWIRPSGFFGLGLQSVFALTDTVSIRTRSSRDVGYEITIRSSESKTPSLVVRTADIWQTGTEVSFSMEEKAVPTSFSGSPHVMERFRRFDPLSDPILNISEATIEEEVFNFGVSSDVPVFFNDEPVPHNPQRFVIADTDNGMEYNVDFTLGGGRCDWMYRGRPFKSSLHFPMIGVIGNIRVGKADMYLSPNREEAHRDGRARIAELFRKSLMDRKTEILPHTTNESLARLYYFLNESAESDGDAAGESWRDVVLSDQRLGDLIVPGNTVYLVEAPMTERFDASEYELDDIPVIHPHDGGAEVPVQVLDRLNMGVKILEYKHIDVPDRFYPESTSKVRLYKVEITATGNESRIEEQAIRDLSDAKLPQFNTRYFIPCGAGQYPEISIPIDNIPAWVTPLCRYPFPFPRVIVLRSTQRDIDEDKETLTTMIMERNDREFSRAHVNEAIGRFYREYEFDSAETNYLSDGD